mmetsp:Transcript_71123/g.199886  ORF Transcript_71123/g.199886 Transcript_71123/m.199886 type:complete len:1661 (-) Transcript_71123:544-5526(-)
MHTHGSARALACADANLNPEPCTNVLQCTDGRERRNAAAQESEARFKSSELFHSKASATRPRAKPKPPKRPKRPTLANLTEVDDNARKGKSSGKIKSLAFSSSGRFLVKVQGKSVFLEEVHARFDSSETGSARAWVQITSEKALRCARFKRGEDPFLDARHFELVYCGDNGKVVCIEGHKNGEFHEKWVHDRADYQRYPPEKEKADGTKYYSGTHGELGADGYLVKADVSGYNEGWHKTVDYVEYCADGSCIAAVGKDSKVAILDATNGQLIAQWESEIVPKRDRLLTVCWSPEIVKGSGMYQLACGGWSNSPLFVLNFNKKEKRLVEQFEGPSHSEVNAVDWSPDGTLLAVAWGNSQGVDLFHVASQASVTTIKRNGSTKALKFSPDGLTIAMGGEDKSVTLYEVATGELVMELEEEAHAIHSIGKLHFEVEELKGTINAISWYPDGKLIAVGSDSSQAALVRTCPGEVLFEDTYSAVIQSIEYSPDGERIAVAIFDRNEGIVIIDSLHGGVLKKYPRKGGKARCITWTQDSKKIIVAGEGGTVDMVNLDTPDDVAQISTQLFKVAAGHDGNQECPGSVQCAKCSPDGKWVAFGSFAQKHIPVVKPAARAQFPARLRRPTLQSSLLALDAFDDAIQPIKVGDVCRVDKTNSSIYGETVRVVDLNWNVRGKNLVKVSIIAGAQRGVFRTYALDQLVRLQVRGRDMKGVDDPTNWDCSVTVVNIETGETTFTCMFGGAGKDKYAVRNLAWSPDGKQLVVVGDFGKAHVLDAEAGIVVHTIHNNGDKIWAADWSPLGNKIVVGGHCKNLAMYTMNKESSAAKEVWAQGWLEKQNAVIEAVAFSPDGRLVAVGGYDNQVAVRSAESGDIYYVLERQGSIHALAWAPSGLNLAIGDDRKHLIAINGVERMAPPVTQISLDETVFKPLPITLKEADAKVGDTLLERALRAEKETMVAQILDAPLGTSSIDGATIDVCMATRNTDILALLLKAAMSPAAPMSAREAMVEKIPELVDDFDFVLADVLCESTLEQIGVGFQASAQDKDMNEHTSPLKEPMQLCNSKPEASFVIDKYWNTDLGADSMVMRSALPNLGSAKNLALLLKLENKNIWTSDTIAAVIDPIYDNKILMWHFEEFMLYLLLCICFSVSSIIAVDQKPQHFHEHITLEIYTGPKEDYSNVKRVFSVLADIACIGLSIYFLDWEYRQARGGGFRWIAENKAAVGEAEKTEDDKIAADKRAAAAAEAKAQADTKVLGALVMSLRRFWMSNIMPCFTKNTADLLTLVLVLFTSLAHLCNLSSTLGEVRKGFFIIKSFASVLQILKILNFMRGFEKFAWVVGVIQQNTVDMIEFLIILGIFIFFMANAFILLFAPGIQQNWYGDAAVPVEEWLKDWDGFEDGEHYSHFLTPNGTATEEGLELYLEYYTFYKQEHDGESYDGLATHDRGTIISFLIAYMDTFNMGVLGDFGSFNQKDFGRTQINSHAANFISLIFVILTNVIVLNALIALLGDSFSRVMESRELEERKKKAELIVEYLYVLTDEQRDKVENDCKWGFRLTPIEKQTELDDGVDVQDLGAMISGLRQDIQSEKKDAKASVTDEKLGKVHERMDEMEKSMRALQQSLDRIMPVMAVIAQKEGVTLKEEEDDGELLESDEADMPIHMSISQRLS